MVYMSSIESEVSTSNENTNVLRKHPKTYRYYTYYGNNCDTLGVSYVDKEMSLEKRSFTFADMENKTIDTLTLIPILITATYSHLWGLVKVDVWKSYRISSLEQQAFR